MTGGPAPLPPAPPYGQAPYPPAYAQAPLSAPPYGQAPPYPYYPQPYAWPVPPQKPRRRWAWVVVALAILAATASGVVALWPGRGGQTALWHLPGNLEAPPAADASQTEWNAWARRAVDASVAGQADALVSGDAEGYLAAVDPSEHRLHDALAHRYDVLRQMGIGQWHQQVRGRPEVTGEFAWHVDVRVTYCFGESTCRLNTVVIGTDWRLDGDHLVLTDLANTSDEQYGPRPWETGELAIGTGARSVVATSARLSDRLDTTLAAAERAAAIADSMARWSGPPSRYVVFLASTTDWAEWYGSGKPEWAGGIYIDDTDNEVVVNSQVREIQDMLTHEFTHVSTLAGERRGRNDRTTWWLVEGIAEYAMMLDRPVSEYEGIRETRSYVRAEDGVPVVEIPGFEATIDEAAGAYGVAFLGVRRLADRYGQDAMLDFFGRVVHDGQTLEEAAPEAFGQNWESVRSDCETYIRSI